MLIILGILVLLTVFAVTPVLIQYAIKKGRFDTPSARKVHNTPTPRIGGHVFVPIIFAAWAVYKLILQPEDESQVQVLSLLTSVTILFVIGIFDDFKDLSHRIKLPFQFLASGIVIYAWNLVPMDMGGVFGIHTIHGWWGWLLMLLFFQFTINALNYTDGVNGLLGGYALFVFGFLTLWGYSLNASFMFPLLFLFCSGLLAFLFFNFRTTAKTFMGDSGSTVIGLVASIMTARMIQLNPEVELSIGPMEYTLPVFFVFVLLFWYPLFDSLQVYTRRILSGKSPFKADRGHFHHYLMGQTNKNHLLTTSVILLVTGLMVAGLLFSL
jgi:UDP-GlcNAc:undecaprenyl-phosphate GlcNAc-1-phosphate transferase